MTCVACGCGRHAGVEQVPGIRGPHAARPAGTVDGNRVEADVGQPEVLLDCRAQPLRRAPQRVGALGFAPPLGEPGHRPPRAVGVPLDFDQRDRRLRHGAIGMKDRIDAVLPSLIDETDAVGARVVDKAVAVGIAAPLDPRHRGLERWPKPVDEGEIARASRIGACEQHEQRRRVDAAVIATKRHFAQRRQLAFARFVQNLARRRVVEGGSFVRLIFGQELQHAARNGGIEPEQLQCGDDAVASERGGEPGNPRVRIRPGGQLRGEQREIRARLFDPHLERPARTMERAAAPALAPHRPACLCRRAPEALVVGSGRCARRRFRDRVGACRGAEAPARIRQRRATGDRAAAKRR